MRYVSILFSPKHGDVPHSGGIYTPEWADKLSRGIERNSPDSHLVVLRDSNPDLDSGGVGKNRGGIGFTYPERDWSSMMEMFRPDVVDPDGAILLGLDTIIVGNLEPLEAACKGFSCVVPLDPYRQPQICNALVYVSQERASKVWEKWTVGRWAYMQDHRYFLLGKFSEMLWLREHLEPDALWDNILPGAVQSWKVDLHRGFPRESTIVVYFHGREKPQDINQKWIEEHWK